MHTPTYTTQFVCHLTNDQQSKIKALTQTAPDFTLSSPTPEKIALHIDKYCSDTDIIGWILAYENNEIIGRTALFKRTIEIVDKKISLGGIGKVRVRLDKRKHGIGSQMMDEAMKQLKKENCDVAFLCTNLDSFLKHFYEKYGFVAIPHAYTYTGKSGKIYSGTDGMLAPITSKDIYTTIMNGTTILHIGVGNW